MIDNYAQATALVERMTASVPIPARPTRQLLDLLRSKGASLGTDPKLEIKNVFCGGDEGGIMCDVTPGSMSKEAVVCSLTHLRVHPKYHLAGGDLGLPGDAYAMLGRFGSRGGQPYLRTEKRR
jgi:hypothetical protein